MISHLLFVLELFIISLLFALVEIQIEGPNGWAANIPTWRVKNIWSKIIMGSKPLTGYHVYLILFIFAVVHCPFALSLAHFTLRNELRILSFMILFWVVEDFLWFVFNPAFGVRKFKKEYIWWHESGWIWIAPREYWIFIPVGVAMYFFSYRN